MNTESAIEKRLIHLGSVVDAQGLYVLVRRIKCAYQFEIHFEL